ncbi:unnamed protein product [Vitrella brassicaformis CCMP3155]|uniref:Cadherin-like beta-sandwich-like domain-containing protein n=2 Tax=Vitrella brassicaformis TaxID=1169539 RepID=A0A0G4E9K6_VITBC|nr:unnamed protein product [Vitrella brassicaformis CCMP3155]|eukprot:CEL92093.1 unnamed protein product [Vitrella brassicaformis CCMP3155]
MSRLFVASRLFVGSLFFSVALVFTASMPDASLRFLDIRCDDRRVDLRPAFRPSVVHYAATMDFDMTRYAVDAVPTSNTSTVEGPVGTEVTISPGEHRKVTVSVVNGGKKTTYTISLQRLSGEDVTLASLQVAYSSGCPGADSSRCPTGCSAHAPMCPPFNPHRVSYLAYLPLNTDDVVLTFEGADGGQSCAVYDSAALGQDKGNQSDAGAAVGGRRFLGGRMAGEVQRKGESRLFHLDPGKSRQIIIEVTPALQTGSAGKYTINIVRDGCPEEHPFYSADAGACTSKCSRGFYGDSVASRCSHCGELCGVCENSQVCLACIPSGTMWEGRFLLRGKCYRFGGWWMWSIAVAVGAVIVGLLGWGIYLLVMWWGGCSGCCERGLPSQEEEMETLKLANKMADYGYRDGGVPLVSPYPSSFSSTYSLPRASLGR